MVYIPVGVNVNDGTVRRENDRERGGGRDMIK